MSDTDKTAEAILAVGNRVQEFTLYSHDDLPGFTDGEYDLDLAHLQRMAKLWLMRKEILRVSKEIVGKLEANSYCESWQQHKFNDYREPLSAIVAALEDNDE